MTPSALQILQAQPELTKNSGVEVDRVALCLPEVGCDVDARRLWGMKPGYLAIRAAVSTVAFRRERVCVRICERRASVEKRARVRRSGDGHWPGPVDWEKLKPLIADTCGERDDRCQAAVDVVGNAKSTGDCKG